jgi:RNA polymerase sigma factor (sigma-70 family)
MADDADHLDGDGSDPGDAIDRGLLARWVDGDPQAGDELMRRHFIGIQRYFIRRAPEQQEDLVQDTFVALSTSKASYRGDAPVRVFLYRIARNVLRMYFRSQGRQPGFDPLTSSVAAAYGRRPSSALAGAEEHTILLNALQEITSDDQDLLELRYWRGLTGPELRDLFNEPEGTMRSRIRAALKRLRSKFDEISNKPRSDVTEEMVERWMVELRPMALS